MASCIETTSDTTHLVLNHSSSNMRQQKIVNNKSLITNDDIIKVTITAPEDVSRDFESNFGIVTLSYKGSGSVKFPVRFCDLFYTGVHFFPPAPVVPIYFMR